MIKQNPTSNSGADRTNSCDKPASADLSIHVSIFFFNVEQISEKKKK